MQAPMGQGGAAGTAIRTVIMQGFKRGVFSNVREPVKQGMWGIFEVFADTMIVCTLLHLDVKPMLSAFPEEDN